MKNAERVIDWLKRAKSNLARARIGAISDEILYEDLCFDAQQAVEKALKALCISKGIIFPKTHDIVYLFELLEQDFVIPEEIRKAALLNEYAVEKRYPGDYGIIQKEDYLLSLELAEKVIIWIENKLEE
jgi:HEPN domain-containing protein